MNQVNITPDMLEKAELVTCPACEDDKGEFQPILGFKNLSKFVTGTPQDIQVPLQALRCPACGVTFGQTVPTKEQWNNYQKELAKRN